MFWHYWWLIGAGVLIAGSVIAIFHVVMVVVDHRRHRKWSSTLLAIVWPIISVLMIGVLQGNMDPPLFGIPLFVLFSMAWRKDKRSFWAGLVLFYALCAMVLGVATSNCSQIHWPFLWLWPASAGSLILWRCIRVSVLGVT